MKIVKNISFTAIDALVVPNVCVVDGSDNPDAVIQFGNKAIGPLVFKIQRTNLWRYKTDLWVRRALLILGYSCSIGVPLLFIGNLYLAMAAVAFLVISMHFLLLAIETLFWPPYIRIGVNGGVYDFEIRSSRFARVLFESNRSLIEVVPLNKDHG